MKVCPIKRLLAALLLAPLIMRGGGPALPGGAGVLSLEDRIKAQTAIERVFYEKRIWPKENKTPKPPFEQMVPKELIEKKVNESLLKSAAMEKYWNYQITPQMLQAELDRMAKGTQDAQTLHELFEALGNDPRLIAETLARETLSDRLVRSRYAWDTRFHTDARARAEAIAARCAMRDARCSTGYGAEPHRHVYVLDDKAVHGHDALLIPGMNPDETRVKGDEFAALKEKYSRPRARTVHPGMEELSSGIHPLETAEGFTLQRALSVTDARIEIETIFVSKTGFDEWWEKAAALTRASSIEHRTPIFSFHLPAITAVAGCDEWTSPTGLNNILPSPRYDHTAVWTGTEMIVWGGTDGTDYLNTGGRYNPATDTWAPTSVGTNLPTPRRFHSAIWTGTEMIIWGGDLQTSGLPINTGGRYDPLTNKWTPTSTGVNVPSSRDSHAALWTGNEMIIWGGQYGTTYFNTGARYSAQTDSWLPTSVGTNVPSQRDTAAVWTGNEMVVWGGGSYVCSPSCGVVYYNDGGRYNPSTDSWQPTSTGTNLPAARAGNSAVWTGTEMIIWGGRVAGSLEVNSGGRYNPATNTWQPTSIAAGTPAPRRAHTAVWTGSKMIAWGGVYCPGSPCGSSPVNYNDGGRYDPVSDTWTATSTGVSVPAARWFHTAVWTGNEMVVWGGWQCNGNPCPGVNFNSGGRYNPNTDSWSPTSMGGTVPIGRFSHSAVWTGAEMIVWGGGGYGVGLVNTGSRYNPALDNWINTSNAGNVPSARDYHTAIWTGNEMIVWGGYPAYTNTGGRYDPTSDSWSQTSTGTNVPQGRALHTSVWSGAEMLVWGGNNSTTYSTDAGKYNPSSDTWMPISTGSNAPSARNGHTAVWTGTEMIIWGGGTYTTQYDVLNTGGRYDPTADSWISTSLGMYVPDARGGQLGTWTGKEMIIWGGYNSSILLNSGGRYNPSVDRWTATSLVNVPTARSTHKALWTGVELLFWGGGDGTLYGTDTGGRYNVGADSWLSTSLGPNSPDHRYDHTAVWSGSNMVIWGGQTEIDQSTSVAGEYLNTGGIYVSGSVSSPGNSLRGKKSSMINLNWSTVFGVGSYNVKRCNPSATACIPSTTISTPTINQYSEPNDSLSHFYAVEAVNQCGATP